jgi:hypothetical protein
MYVIESSPQSVLGVCKINTGENASFYIIGEDSVSNLYEWYLDGNLVSLGVTYTLVNPAPGTYNVYVIVKGYSGDYWLGGNFYGGNFYGNFAGGTFHYGNLNNVEYTNRMIKPKPFIVEVINSIEN